APLKAVPAPRSDGTTQKERSCFLWIVRQRSGSGRTILDLGILRLRIARRTLWHELTPALALFNMGFGAKFKPGFARVKV
ncbi:MAG: hypothetical protein PHU77_00405, partial [Simplicispira sp.]|nr:hypothetical protein [Simplicispira sp.]